MKIKSIGTVLFLWCVAGCGNADSAGDGNPSDDPNQPGAVNVKPASPQTPGPDTAPVPVAAIDPSAPLPHSLESDQSFAQLLVRYNQARDMKPEDILEGRQYRCMFLGEHEKAVHRYEKGLILAREANGEIRNEAWMTPTFSHDPLENFAWTPTGLVSKSTYPDYSTTMLIKMKVDADGKLFLGYWGKACAPDRDCEEGKVGTVGVCTRTANTPGLHFGPAILDPNFAAKTFTIPRMSWSDRDGISATEIPAGLTRTKSVVLAQMGIFDPNLITLHLRDLSGNAVLDFGDSGKMTISIRYSPPAWEHALVRTSEGLGGAFLVGINNEDAHYVYYFQMNKVLPSGILDPAFGDKGTILLRMPNCVVEGMVVLASRQIQIWGRNVMTGNSFIQRFDSVSGASDASFGIDGRREFVDLSLGGFDPYSETFYAQKYELYKPSYRSLAQRLHSDGSPDLSLGPNGVTDIEGGRDTEFKYWVQNSSRFEPLPSGRGYQAIYGGEMSDEFVAIRTTGNFGIDSQFGTQGRLNLLSGETLQIPHKNILASLGTAPSTPLWSGELSSPDGSMVVVNGHLQGYLVARIRENGTVDRSLYPTGMANIRIDNRQWPHSKPMLIDASVPGALRLWFSVDSDNSTRNALFQVVQIKL